MNQCMSFKTDGDRCINGAVPNIVVPNGVIIPDHLHLCRIHQGAYSTRYISNNQTHHTAGCCLDRVGTYRWCTQAATDNQNRCVAHTTRHTTVAARREAVRVRVARQQAVLAHFTQRVPAPNWRDVVRELFAVPAPEVLRQPGVNVLHVIRDYYARTHTAQEPRLWQGGDQLLHAYIVWIQHGAVGQEPQAVPPPPPPPVLAPLAQIARDSQNVHRAVVSEQTNRNVDLILATPNVNEHCRAHELLAAIWLNLRIASWANVRTTVDDIVYWRNRDMCRTQGDHLYRRILHALFTRIYTMSDGELRKELWRRFYQECEESVGMCCEGHISRLSNVLVGFEDDFKPPVPFGEILQNRMATIAEMDLPMDDKVKLALAFFDEHKVPQEARAAWLDAF